MSDSQENVNASTALMNMGGALNELQNSQQAMTNVAERMTTLTSEPMRRAHDLSEENQARLCELAANAMREVAKRNRAYASALGAVMDQFEREMDELTD